MKKAMIKRLSLLLCLALCVSIAPAALSNGGGFDTSLHTISCGSGMIYIYWDPVPTADYVELYRGTGIGTQNMALIKTFDHVNSDPWWCSHEDWGLSLGQVYTYRVIVWHEGNAYPSIEAHGVPLDLPVITDIKAHRNLAEGLLSISLTWEPVNQATVYKVRDWIDGALTTTERFTTDTSVLCTYPLPDEVTSFSYDVYAGVYPGGDFYTGPVSLRVRIIYEPLDPGLFHMPIYMEEIDPWDFPWEVDWLKELWRVYGDPALQPMELNPDSGEFALFARRVLSGKELSQLDERMLKALSPEGLSLLETAIVSPPDSKTAQYLRGRLSRLNGNANEALNGLIDIVKNPSLIISLPAVTPVPRTPDATPRPVRLYTNEILPFITVEPLKLITMIPMETRIPILTWAPTATPKPDINLVPRVVAPLGPMTLITPAPAPTIRLLVPLIRP